MPVCRLIRLPVIGLALAMAMAMAMPSGRADAAPVLNSGFDTDLGGWSNPFARPAAWDPLDALGAPGSGSARVGNDQPGNNGTSQVLSQCVPVLPGQAYRFGALARVVPGQPALVYVRLVAQALATPDCSGDPLSSHFDSQFSTDTSWRLIGGEVPGNPSLQSIRLWLAISKPAGVNEPVFVQFDDVHLFADRIFGNGFQP